MTRSVIPPDLPGVLARMEDRLRRLEREITPLKIAEGDLPMRAQRMLTGGGFITYTAAGLLSWSARFIVISMGRGPHFAASGYFDITMPPNGTVIPGVGGASGVTVSGGAIQMPVWGALYYILPIGASNASVAANFRMVSYNVGDVEIPNNWVLIAVNNGDSSYIKLATGPVLKAGANLNSNSITPTSQDNFETYGTFPAITMVDSDGPVDKKRVRIVPDAGTMYMQWVNDANTVAESFLEVDMGTRVVSLPQGAWWAGMTGGGNHNAQNQWIEGPYSGGSGERVTVQNSTQLKPNVAGYYLCGGSGHVGSQSAGRILFNNVTEVARSDAGQHGMNCPVGIAYFNGTTDYFSYQFYQTAAGQQAWQILGVWCCRMPMMT